MATNAGNGKKGSKVKMCSVQRIDASNAICTTDNPACPLATPYGNYCEHARAYQLGEFIMPGEACFHWPLRNPR